MLLNLGSNAVKFTTAGSVSIRATAVDDPDAPEYARLIGPNLWPAALPELREVTAQWQEHLAGVARKLLRAWALALGAPETYFDEHFGEPSTLLKIVR